MSEEMFQNIDTDPGPEKADLSDDEVRQRIERLFAGNDYLKDREIEVIVKDCAVTLEGVVFSPQSWQRASDLATGVQGVSEVINHIRVEPGFAGPGER